MQSFCGKLRSAAKLTLNNLRIGYLDPIASVESSKLGYSRVHRSSSALLLNRNFGTEFSSATSPRSVGIVSSLPSCRCLSPRVNQSANLMLSSSARNIATSAPASPYASATLDAAPLPHIKFKRLDKTARHIMQEVPENKRRVSTIKGIVIARRNTGLNITFRLPSGVGVESLFPLYSPNIKEIKVLEKKKMRRAKLYYLRDKLNALKRQ